MVFPKSNETQKNVNVENACFLILYEKLHIQYFPFQSFFIFSAEKKTHGA